VILLAGLLDVLFRAFAFVGLALAVGGIFFRFFVLRPATRALSSDSAGVESTLGRAATLTASGALLVAIFSALALVVAPWSLAEESGDWPLKDFLATGFARAAMLHAAVAFFLTVACLFLRSRPRSGALWAVAAVLAGLTMASGGPLTHAASRLTDPLLLMAVTILHQLPAAVWVGGTVHLAAQERLLRDRPAGQWLWPGILARFSPVALTCVMLLLAAGLYLTWRYVRDPAGLLGTAYGTMLLTKVVLTAAALGLGRMNFRAIRDWKRSGRTDALWSRVPPLVETEAAIGICVLMAAAAFTSQPPAVDVADGRASPAEVARVFGPKVPQLTMPPFREMVSTAAQVLDPYALPSELDKVQSNFNHTASGAFVLLAALGALLYGAGRASRARHWPLVFVGLGVFVLLIAEPTVWPLGPEPFWATLMAPQVLVHRLAALLVMGLGVFEWRVRAGGLGGTRWRYVFPLLCFAGGALMLTHSHSVFATKWAFLIEVSHNVLGILAVLAGAARWLELRLPAREGRVAGGVWPVCLALVGLVLLFYRET
jgi:putative copper resistance protein D